MIEASPERDPDAATVAELEQRDWWREWESIRCPALVLRGARGSLAPAVAERMAAILQFGAG